MTSTNDDGVNQNEFLDVNCGRCGKPLLVRIADVGEARLVEYEACVSRPPFNRRQVFVAFDKRRTDSTRCD